MNSTTEHERRAVARRYSLCKSRESKLTRANDMTKSRVVNRENAVIDDGFEEVAVREESVELLEVLEVHRESKS